MSVTAALVVNPMVFAPSYLNKTARPASGRSTAHAIRTRVRNRVPVAERMDHAGRLCSPIAPRRCGSRGRPAPPTPALSRVHAANATALAAFRSNRIVGREPGLKVVSATRIRVPNRAPAVRAMGRAQLQWRVSAQSERGPNAGNVIQTRVRNRVRAARRTGPAQ